MRGILPQFDRMEALKVLSLSRAWIGLTLAVLFLIAIDLASQTPAPGALTLLSKDGRRIIPLSVVNDQESVNLDDLAEIFQLSIREDQSGALTASYKGKTIVLMGDQPLASVAGRLVSLPSAPVRVGRRWAVPVEFISRAVALVYESKLDLRKASHLLIVGDLRVPRVTVRFDPAGTGGRVTVDATPRATLTVTQEKDRDRDRLVVRFDADAIDVPQPAIPVQGPQSVVQAVRVADPVTLAIDLGPRFVGYRATQSADTGAHLILDLLTQQPEAQAPQPSPTAPTPSPEFPAAIGASAVRTIAIDPGHGGDDEGVKGASGTTEKALTLEIARRLKTALEARLGIRVMLTRDDDRVVSFDDRAATANNSKTELFISLHANASLRPAASGATIYYSLLGDDAQKAVPADRGERLPILGGGSRDIELVPWNAAQARYIDQSKMFAGVVEEQFHDRVPLAARAVERAPLRVLESGNQPAVLI